VFIPRYRLGEFLKCSEDPLEEYFMKKFKEMGIPVISPKKKRKKQDYEK
jgi:hypothetical protein